MLAADTVILTVDASLPAAALGAQLNQLRQFLELLREVRGRRADVADLPVYLVLTKCDRLAPAGASLGEWAQRVEDAKRRLEQHFRDLLAASLHDVAFGSLDLHLWATATRRPAGAGETPEPYGVAELFRQCLDSAREYHARRGAARNRLGAVAAGMAGLLGALAVLATAFVLSQPDPELARLEDQVRMAVTNPAAPAAERLRAPLDLRLAQLRLIEEDPDFTRLPAATREQVERARAEMDAYLRANQRFQEQVKKPYLAKDEKEFIQFERQAREFALPPAYAAAWDDTRLARRLDQVRREYAQVRRALAAEEAWTRDRIKEGEALLREGERVYAKMLQGDKLAPDEPDAWFLALRDYSRPRVRVPGHERLPGVSALTYDDLAKFASLRQARKDWHAVKDELGKLYNLVEARLKKAG
jgi:hypothetical protein